MLLLVRPVKKLQIKININPWVTNKDVTSKMNINMTAVHRESIKRARREKKKNLKHNNKKMSRNVKKYHDDFEI